MIAFRESHPRLSGRRWVRLASPALAFVLVAGACNGDAEAGRPMRLEVLEGEATLIRDGRQEVIRSHSAVGVGDTIVLRKGLAELRLARGRIFELSNAEVSITGSAGLRLVRGDLLADVTAPARVDAESVEVLARKGAFRINRALATRVGAYEGKVDLRADADELSVPRYRQAIVAGGVLPTVARPLRISAADRWDRRYLQDALDLDARLSNFGRGLEAQLGSASGLPFFQAVAPTGLDVAFVAPFLGGRRSDVLIALMLALEAKRGATLEGRFTRMFELWRDGASWGLVAREFGVEQPNLFTRLLDAIARAGIVFTGGRGPALRRAPSPPPPGRGSPGPSPTDGSTITSKPPSPSPILPQEVCSPAPSEGKGLLNDLIGLVNPSPAC